MYPACLALAEEETKVNMFPVEPIQARFAMWAYEEASTYG